MPSRSRAMPREAQLRLRKKLKELVLKLSKEEGMPYWNVLTNVAIAKIAKYLPSTLNDLRLISEVPPSQARKYSDKIFECVDMFVEMFERELREKRRAEESKRAHDPLVETISSKSGVTRDYSRVMYPPGLGFYDSNREESSLSKHINDPSYWLRPRMKNRKTSLPPRSSLLAHVTIFRKGMSNPWQYIKKNGAKEKLEQMFGVTLKIMSMRPFHAVAQGSPQATRDLERHLHDIVSMYRKPKRVRGISNTDLNFQDDEIERERCQNVRITHHVPKVVALQFRMNSMRHCLLRF